MIGKQAATAGRRLFLVGTASAFTLMSASAALLGCGSASPPTDMNATATGAAVEPSSPPKPSAVASVAASVARDPSALLPDLLTDRCSASVPLVPSAERLLWSLEAVCTAGLSAVRPLPQRLTLSSRVERLVLAVTPGCHRLLLAADSDVTLELALQTTDLPLARQRHRGFVVHPTDGVLCTTGHAVTLELRADGAATGLLQLFRAR